MHLSHKYSIILMIPLATHRKSSLSRATRTRARVGNGSSSRNQLSLLFQRGVRACNRRNAPDINPQNVINDWVLILTQLSENNTRSTSTKCKCKWLTLARAPGLLNPIRHRRLLNLARSDKEQSSATSFNTCGELVARSGHSRQWLRVSGLLLTRTVMRWSPN